VREIERVDLQRFCSKERERQRDRAIAKKTDSKRDRATKRCSLPSLLPLPLPLPLQDLFTMYPVVLHCPQRYGDKYTSQAMTIMKRGTRRIFHALTMADLLATVKDASKGKAKNLSAGVAEAAAAAAATDEPSTEALARVVKAFILQDKEKVLEMRAKQMEAHEAQRVRGPAGCLAWEKGLAKKGRRGGTAPSTKSASLGGTCSLPVSPPRPVFRSLSQSPLVTSSFPPTFLSFLSTQESSSSRASSARPGSKTPKPKKAAKGAASNEPQPGKKKRDMMTRAEEEAHIDFVDDQPGDGPDAYWCLYGFDEPEWIQALAAVGCPPRVVLTVESEDDAETVQEASTPVEGAEGNKGAPGDVAAGEPPVKEPTLVCTRRTSSETCGATARQRLTLCPPLSTPFSSFTKRHAFCAPRRRPFRPSRTLHGLYVGAIIASH
jgi:hypothetical protein